MVGRGFGLKNYWSSSVRSSTFTRLNSVAYGADGCLEDVVISG